MSSTESQHWASTYFIAVEDTDFFGRLIFEFKGGEIVLVRKEETFLPPPFVSGRKVEPR